MSTFAEPKAYNKAKKMGLTPFLPAEAGPRKTAIFMSGSGANAEAILASLEQENAPSYEVVALVTDRPTRSRTAEIAAHFGLPVVAEDIFAFYQQHGLKRVSIANETGREIRRRWTDALREKLAPLQIDFGIFAGFVPLCNIAGDYPCLNVHPGDLTVLDEQGERMLVGLHSLPIERAILAGHAALRSSVIVAQPFIAGGGNMDSGPLLGISGPVEIDLGGATNQELAEIATQRPGRRPVKGFDDRLEAVAEQNLERLKHNGDLVLFPRVVADFAAGRFALGANEQLYFAPADESWVAVETVAYEPAPRPVLSN